MDEQIQRVLQYWTSHFPDVPCMYQAVHVPALAGTQPSSFCLHIVGNATDVRIEPYHDSVSGQSILAESEYSLRLDEKTGAVHVEIKADPSLPVRGLNFQRLGGSHEPVRLLCLQNDGKQADQWLVCYNGMDREKELLLGLSKNVLSVKNPHERTLLQFLQAMLEGHQGRALTLYEANTVLKNSRSALQGIVHRYGKQLNAHGMKRTFAYWSATERAAYLSSAQVLIKRLSQSFPDTCIGFGAVLGRERDADLIAHDDDIDVLVAFQHPHTPSLPHALAQLSLFLGQNGYVVEGTFFSHLWVRTPEDFRMDVFVGMVEDKGRLSFYPSARHGLSYDTVFPAVNRDLCGQQLPFPRNPEDYLDRTYGQGWRQADLGFAHPWDRASYQDLDGPRQQAAIVTRGELAKQVRLH